MKIALFHGQGMISCMIRWQTWTEFSHAGVILTTGHLVEAWPGGVRCLNGLKNGTDGVRFFRVPGLTPEQEQDVESFLLRQVGKGYDYGGVLRFLSRAGHDTGKKWFCSELVYAAFSYAGVHLLQRTDPWEVSPGLLSRSPLLEETSL